MTTATNYNLNVYPSQEIYISTSTSIIIGLGIRALDTCYSCDIFYNGTFELTIPIYLNQSFFTESSYISKYGGNFVITSNTDTKLNYEYFNTSQFLFFVES